MKDSTRDNIADYGFGFLLGLSMFFTAASPTYVMKIFTFGIPSLMIMLAVHETIPLKRCLLFLLGFIPTYGIWFWYAYDKIIPA